MEKKLEPEQLDNEDLEIDVVEDEDWSSQRTAIKARCATASIECTDAVHEDGTPSEELFIVLPCGREKRSMFVYSRERADSLLGIPFEKYRFLPDYEGIVSFELGTLEVGIRPSSPRAANILRTVGRQDASGPDNTADFIRFQLPPPHGGLPTIALGPPSLEYRTLGRPYSKSMTIKLSDCRLTTSEQAVTLIERLASAVLFQLDLATGACFVLDRSRPRGRSFRLRTAREKPELRYPNAEFDFAPLSLYWYGRSAVGMPLLQYLAFYQVLEFYFPIYSQAEAQRRVKSLLKDPTFRGDRDADVAKLLTLVQQSRSGGYGDERAQLKATIMECIDSEALREFLQQEPRADFFSAKSKGNSYHRIPVNNPNTDLRSDVAERVYEIRCKIVHTKSDARDREIDLLLPFSMEAEQLKPDVELVEYLAQRVLIVGSHPLPH